ncbi:MAG: hypothetical protein ACJAWO_000119 [Halieaceae bacterium]|jgi:hypothetical protein
MKILITLFISLIINFQSLGQYTLIPDSNFEQALIDLGYDSGPKNGWVLTASIAQVYYLGIPSKNIKSLNGIEDFVNLERLDCWNNELTALNTSNNLLLTHLACQNNNLEVIDVSQNHKLTWLFCGNNNLRYLNVSKNIQLTHLDCYDNKLTVFDISKNLKLEWVMCALNQLTKIDVSKHIHLRSLQCGQNSISGVDVSKNIELEYLSCDNNLLTEIDVSLNPKLLRLLCGNNNIKNLNFENNLNLTSLSFYDTPIYEIDISNKILLKYVEFSNTPLACLNFGVSESVSEEITLTASNVPNLSCIDIGNLNKSQFKWLYLDDGITLQKDCIFSCEPINDTSEVKKINISVYPNPTNGNFTVSFNGEVVEHVEGVLINAIGQKIKYYEFNLVSEFAIEINQSSGVYFLQLITGSSQPIIYKILKQ